MILIATCFLHIFSEENRLYFSAYLPAAVFKMGERKVLNYYIPYDFDASIIPKGARDRSKPIEVRTMLAFSIQCNTCNEYMYRGKKFNAKCERIENETYLGIKKFRFYIKCSVCSAEIIFKTDPQNSDYEMESGASRNFELWRDTAEQVAAVEQAKAAQENCDSMKALENRTLDSKIEMDVLDALDEVRAQNKRHEKVDTNSLLQSLSKKEAPKVGTAVKLNADGLTEEDEEMLQSFRQKKRKLEISETGNAVAQGVVMEEIPTVAQGVVMEEIPTVAQGVVMEEIPTSSSSNSTSNSNSTSTNTNNSCHDVHTKKDPPTNMPPPSKPSSVAPLFKKAGMVLIKKIRVGDETAVTPVVTAPKPVTGIGATTTTTAASVSLTKGALPLGDYGSSDSD